MELAVAIATQKFMTIAHPERANDLDKGPVNLDSETPDYGSAGKALEEVFLENSEAAKCGTAVMARPKT